MQVQVEDVSTVKKVLHIEISEDKVTQELEEAYKELKKAAKVKGFRPGTVPRSILEGLYKKKINADVSSKLIQESFESVVRENNLNFLGIPHIDPPELEEKKPFKYDAVIELNPEVGEIGFKGIPLKKTVYKVTPEEIDTQLKMLQKKLADQKPLEEDRPVQGDDIVLIDYEGFKDGKPFAEMDKTENFSMKVGDTGILKEFNEQLIGMKSGGTKEITVSFPNDYPNDKLANQTINFHVSLKEIRKEILPDIDDEFAKKFGKDGLNALKNEIENNLKEGYEKRTEQELNEQAFKFILEQKNFEVPDIMINYELENIVSDAERSFAFHNTSLEELGLTKEGLSEKYRDTAVKQVKRHLILGKIIEQEKLTISEEELEEGLNEMSKTSFQPAEEIKKYYEQNQEKFDSFKHMLLEKKAAKLIIDNSKIEEVGSEK